MTKQRHKKWKYLAVENVALCEILEDDNISEAPTPVMTTKFSEAALDVHFVS